MSTAYLTNKGKQSNMTSLPPKHSHIIATDAGLAPSEVAEIDLYQRREKIYTRAMQGFYQKIRLFTGWPLLIAYFVTPWLSFGGQPLVLFDLPARQFHILGMTFLPQQFPYLAGLLIMAALALFTVTNIAGRVWCGYTCPQTVWTAIYMWIEQTVEGTRNQRIKLDKAPLSFNKARKKVTKHGLWLGCSFATGFTFIAYFTGAGALATSMLELNTSLMALSWVVFFTLATYINAGWLREQVCMYMCPYARFQAAMFDKDTLIISYDSQRGENRGARKRHQAVPEGMGDCIDCKLCVQVCPTGIDIRKGLQYQCIGCALCVDACNSVMDKMGYARGLIAYTSERVLEGGKFHLLRPRSIGYAMMLIVIASGWLWSISHRQTLELDIIRDRQSLYTLTTNGAVENVYTLNFVNFETTPKQIDIAVEGLAHVELMGQQQLDLAANEVRSIPVRLRVHDSNVAPLSTIHFVVESEGELILEEESRFIAPLKRES